MTLESSNPPSVSVLVVGSANQDLTTYTSRLPQLGETVMGIDFDTFCGGKGANQAVAAASLLLPPPKLTDTSPTLTAATTPATTTNTLPSAMFVGQVGQDLYGETLLENFQSAGVLYDESTIRAPPGVSTGVASIVVDTSTGDNCILVVPGANHALTTNQVREAIKSRRPRVVLVQWEVLPHVALEAMKVGREVGAITILNPAPALSPDDAIVTEFYPWVDILIPNETELRLLYAGLSADEMKTITLEDLPKQPFPEEETMARALLDRGVAQAVVVTLGSRGAMVVTRSSAEIVSAPDGIYANGQDIPPVLDTVGAGDCFCGALAAYLSTSVQPSPNNNDHHQIMALTHCARLACGMASLSVRKRGAQSSYPTREEIPQILKIQFPTTPTTLQENKVLPTLTFVTSNQQKFEEVKELLEGTDCTNSIPFHLVSRHLDMTELQGEPLEIAREKCRRAAIEINGPVLTEDTSLCCNALGGLPGPYIKCFLQKCGPDGLNDMLSGFVDKSAYAQTIFAFTMGPGQSIHLFEGRVEGTIVRPRGTNDFGWDSIFEFGGGATQAVMQEEKYYWGKTFAEMSREAKNRVSHRIRAMLRLQSFLAALSL